MNEENRCMGVDECLPIENVEDVLGWSEPTECWASLVKKLEKRTDYCCHSYPVCNYDCDPIYKKADSVPKTLVCHDMKGGYLADRLVNGTENLEEYKFLLWSCIDIFVYFSHKLVTVPPLCWINAGHTHGVKVLGTIITEGDSGCKIWDTLTTDDVKLTIFAIRLAEICEHYGFDGYLINIENPMSQQSVSSFVYFLELLVKYLKKISPDKTVIWYDAMTFPYGRLQWQNKLNNLNKKFFDLCDGIFLNYGWSEQDLTESILEAGSRKTDVYVGVDVFGRGCFGGGGFATCKAMEVIRTHGLSAAIFAPGWVHEECDPDEKADIRDFKFWKLLGGYLYCYGPAKLPFKTSFCRGYGLRKYREGNVVLDHPWFNLSEMNPLPALLSGTHQVEESSCIIYYPNDAYNGGGCLIIKPPLDSEALGKHADRKLVLPVINNLKPEDGPNKWNITDFIFDLGCAHIISIECRMITDKTPVLLGYLSISKEGDTEPSGSDAPPSSEKLSTSEAECSLKVASILCDNK